MDVPSIQERGFEPRQGLLVTPESLAAGVGGEVLEVLTWLARSAISREALVRGGKETGLVEGEGGGLS